MGAKLNAKYVVFFCDCGTDHLRAVPQRTLSFRIGEPGLAPLRTFQVVVAAARRFWLGRHFAGAAPIF